AGPRSSTVRPGSGRSCRAASCRWGSRVPLHNEVIEDGEHVVPIHSRFTDYLIYPEGNCIASSPETPYLQLGESKCGTPILDRIIRPEVSLEDAARFALVSIDSTMKSNLSVGAPLDLAIMRRDQLSLTHKLRIDIDTP